MTRNLKVFGLVLVAVFAMGAVVASGASARFHSELEKPRLTASSNEALEFIRGSFTLKCANLATNGNNNNNIVVLTEEDPGPPVAWTSTDIAFHPVFTNCQAILGQPVAIDSNSCYFTLTSAAGSKGIETHIECTTAGDSFTATIGPNGSLCKIQIAPQTKLDSAGLTNNIGKGAAQEVEVLLTMEKIVSTRTGSILCGPANSTTGAAGSKFTMKAEDSKTGVQVGVWVE